MLERLAPGNVVTVTRINRLARSTFDLFAIVKQIMDAKAQFRSLAEPWADTGGATVDGPYVLSNNERLHALKMLAYALPILDKHVGKGSARCR